MKLRKPEILAPAGNLEILKTAVMYGADAIYLGGEAFGLRAAAKNFSNEEIKEGIEFAHKHNVNVYITANILAHNDDMQGVREYFTQLKDIRPDAVIIADPGVFMIAKEIIGDIPIHISTQANNINYGTYQFWRALGAERVVAGRELSLEEIGVIRQNIPQDMEIEAFVHGAMCMSYSGRCLLSNYMTDKDANAGACTHPCRWKYSLVEEKRPGEYYPVYENERGTFIFNSKDLCMIEHIDKMIEAGIDSLKIEGRMKTALYVASVVKAYRCAVDDYFTDVKLYKKNIPYYFKEVECASRRKFTTGFFFGKADKDSMYYESERSAPSIYYGTIMGSEIIDGKRYVILEQKNKFCINDTLEVIRPKKENIEVKVLNIKDERYNDIDSCPHPRKKLFVLFDEQLDEFDILRKNLIAHYKGVIP